MNFIDIAKKVLITEASELERASTTLGIEIDKAVELIYNTKGKLIITGVGKSGLIGAKIAATFASTGTSSFFLHPTEAMHGDLGMITSGDAILAISYSGESEELIKMLPHIKRFDVPLIAISANNNSTLSSYADVFISCKINQEACPLNVAPTSSTTLTLALGDALAVCLMKKRNFAKEDFASFHPGGTLGKKLFIKVSDLMKKDNLPIINKDTLLKDAILVITNCRVGCALIVDENEKLIGVLSDGDLRRAMLKSDFSLEKKALEYATPKPKTINNKYMLASDAIKIIEEYKIGLIVVTNEENKIKGILTLHDLVEAGIN
jgi:arabinose-5-phosphate isomerase